MLFPFHTLLPYHIHPLIIQDTKHAVKQQAYEVVDNTEEFRLTMEVPGAKVADLVVNVDDTSIKVSVDQKLLKDKDEAQYTFLVDPKTTNLKSTTAKLGNGVLVVTAPKKPQEEPITLHISNDSNDIAQATNALAAEDMFATTMDLPGIAKSDIQVTLKEDIVHVHGVRRITNKSSNKNCNKKVRYSDVFQIDTDEVDIQKLKVVLTDGVLTIFGPKKTKPQPVSIPVNRGLASNTENADESMETTQEKNVEKIVIDVPGVKQNDISVKVLEGRFLSITASREKPTARNYTKTYHLDQDVIEINKIEANLENGQLVITLPQRIKNKPQSIEITVAEDEKSNVTTNDAASKESTNLPENVGEEGRNPVTVTKDDETNETKILADATDKL